MLAESYGTPLLVLCERTLRAQARAYRNAAPGALLAYSVKALPNVEVLRLFAEEGLGADVSTLGELSFAVRAGVPAARTILHGNNKSDEERLAAARDVYLVVLDAADEIGRAAAAGVRRVLVRVTPGIDAETHDAIRTAHHGSKFGLPPDDAIAALAAARNAGLDVAGLHVHIGSQLLELGAGRMTVDRLAGFAAECRARLGRAPAQWWTWGRARIRYVEEERPRPSRPSSPRRSSGSSKRGDHALPPPSVVLEPGRSLVGRAGVTLYRVGVVKRAGETTTYVPWTAACRTTHAPSCTAPATPRCWPTGPVSRRAAPTPCGKHCESGDVLIERVALPEPARGDLLAVPGTGAYTLAMSSNYNGVTRPAVVLVGGGEARLIRRRETVVEDLLGFETA